MKKIICTILALIMLTGACFAQTATLKPEVTLDWGMTIDETQPFFDTLSNVSKDEISGIYEIGAKIKHTGYVKLYATAPFRVIR